NDRHPPPSSVSSPPTNGRSPAARAAWKKRGAPLSPSRSTSASASSPSAAARSTSSSGSDDPRRNENAEDALSSTRMGPDYFRFFFAAAPALLLDHGGGHRRARGEDDAHAVLDGEVGVDHVLLREHHHVADVEVVGRDVDRAQRVGRAVRAREAEGAGHEAGRGAPGQAREHEPLERALRFRLAEAGEDLLGGAVHA